MLWLDSQAYPAIERAPVPLAVFPLNGLYREELCRALDGLGIRWRVSYSSASLAALAAASAAGLGMTLLPAQLPAARPPHAGQRPRPAAGRRFRVGACIYRDNAPAVAVDLADRLIEFCGLQR